MSDYMNFTSFNGDTGICGAWVSRAGAARETLGRGRPRLS